MLIIKSPREEIWKFALLRNKLIYQAIIDGVPVMNIISYQVQFTPDNQVHLCLYDQKKRLHYCLWRDSQWQNRKVFHTSFNNYLFALDQQLTPHLVIKPADRQFFHYFFQGNWRENQLGFLEEEITLLKLFSSNDCPLILFTGKTTASRFEIYLYYYYPDQNCWSKGKLLCNLSNLHKNLNFWRHSNYIYLTYFDLENFTSTLHLKMLKPPDNIFIEHIFQGLSSKAGLPILSFNAPKLTLLCVDQHRLTYWVSLNDGQTWRSKVEIDLKFPCQLEPVFNYTGTISPLVALKSLLNLDFFEPALIEVEKLVKLSPSASPRDHFRRLGKA